MPPGRALDAALRALVRPLAGTSDGGDVGRLSMFPTPTVSYFARCVASPTCKPHLRAFARGLFGDLLDGWRPGPDAPPRSGALFTRFMLAGFAAYRALEDAGVETFESYPDLQFRLWSDAPVPSKRRPKVAFAARCRINARLRRRLKITGSAPATLDQADAEVLAVGAAVAAREGGLVVLDNQPEGRFLVAIDARRLGFGGLTST